MFASTLLFLLLQGVKAKTLTTIVKEELYTEAEKLEEKLYEEIKEVRESVVDLGCLFHTDSESCMNAIDAKSGSTCNWCTSEVTDNAFGVCMTDDQVDKLSHMLSMICDDVADVDEKLKSTVVKDDEAFVQMQEMEGMPDLTCLMNMDPQSCISGLDATNVGCSWCESSVFPKLHGCLTQMEAAEIVNWIEQANEDSQIGLSCSHAKDESIKEPVIDNVQVDMKCLMVTTEEGCLSTPDFNGTPCEWCATINPAMNVLDMCVSVSDSAMLPQSIYTCPKSADTVKDDESVVQEEVGMPDLTCLMNMDQQSCMSGLDATNVGCSWCESSVFPMLQGCLSQMEATEIMNLIEQENEGSQLGLSCSHAKETNEEPVKDNTQVDMKCMAVRTQDDCVSTADATGTPCEWCATVNPAMSMLDMCMSIPDAAMLPQTLYKCGSAGEELPSFEANVMAREEKEITEEQMPSQEFSFVEGVKHTLRSDLVDPQFCDPKSPKSISGYMDISDSKEEKHLYFWMFEKRTKKSLRIPDVNPHTPEDTTPVILWLTGGPGCSSTLALLYENGPCSVNAEGTKTIPNVYSWNEAAHVIFLDQPAGVGFSYADKENTKNEKMVGEDVYYFLQGFYQMHSKYRNSPLFIVGESYGGHYAPAVAHRIMKGNEHLKENTIHVNLKGLAIGNGMTDPKVQYKYYADMAYNNSHKIKTVPKAVYTAMEKATPTCINMINTCTSSQFSSKFICQVAQNYCNMALVAPFTATGLNLYDIRTKCENGDLCYDFDNIVKFMRLKSTRKALHISDESREWATCNMHVHDQFTVDALMDMSSNVIDLLDNGIATLIYAGDTDYICNYLGNKAWTDELKWKHHAEYKDSKPYDWKKQGLAKSYKGLTFLQIYDAGHMVPHDQPKVAVEMIHDFVKRYS